MDYQNIKPLDTIDSLFRLDDKIGLITGGAGKMGRQFAKILALAGAKVIIADTQASAPESAAAEILKESNLKLYPRVCDVSSQGEVNTLFDYIEKQFGRIDFFIHNVMAKPSGYYAPFEKYTKDAWDKVMGTNLNGAFLCCQRAAGIMRKLRNGSIILTSSIYGVVGPDQRIYESCSAGNNPYGAPEKLNAPASYSASKGALIAFCRYLAALYGEFNVRVNILTPGGVYDNHEPAFHDAYVNKVPLKRMAVWTDYNGAVLFLAGEASRYMTGSNLIMDGGWSTW